MRIKITEQGLKVSVIIPYRPGDPNRDKHFPYILNKWKTDFPDFEYIVCDDSDPNTFNRGRAINEGALTATGNLFIFADADGLLEKSSIQKGLDELIKNPDGWSLAVPFKGINFMGEYETFRIMRGEAPGNVTPVLHKWTNGSTGICQIVWADKFFESGGYDPRFCGWGFEDAAWTLYMETFYGPVFYVKREAYHLYHVPTRNPKTDNFVKGQLLCRRYETVFGDKRLMRKLREEAPLI